jgi:hypothetical protein
LAPVKFVDKPNRIPERRNGCKSSLRGAPSIVAELAS